MATAPVAVALLAGLAALLLAVPVDVAFRLERIAAFNGQIALRWLFGLVRFRIRIPGAGKPPSQPKALRRAAGVQQVAEKRGRRANVPAALRQAAFRRRVYRLLADVVAAAHLRQLHLRVRLGLGDPADTGRLWAVVGPLDAMARNLRDAEVRIEPAFTDPVLEFEASGRMLLIPLQLLLLAVGFALSPASIRAWRTLNGRHA